MRLAAIAVLLLPIILLSPEWLTPWRYSQRWRRWRGGKWGRCTGTLYGKRWIPLPLEALACDEDWSWTCSPMECERCGHEWVCVHPGCERVECSICGYMSQTPPGKR